MESLRHARPSQLFLAVDGADDARRPGESELVLQTIQALEDGISWSCKVQTRYSSANSGCRLGVSGAIDWFFENVEAGIVLEDDCIPSASFFSYCTKLLDRYQTSSQVMCISGDNSLHVSPPKNHDYAFVRFPQIWGWATWRSAWSKYDRNLERYASVRGTKEWLDLVPDPLERHHFERILDRLLLEGMPDTWDYQWVATLLLERGVCVHPRVNLVTNIGFGPGATHTRNDSDPRANVPAREMNTFKLRDVVELDVEVSHALFLRTQLGKAHSSQPLPKASLFTLAVRLASAILRRLPNAWQHRLRSVLLSLRRGRSS
jgi:hypothetical protein